MRKHEGPRRALAVFLSLLLALGNAGTTAVAEELASTLGGPAGIEQGGATASSDGSQVGIAEQTEAAEEPAAAEGALSADEARPAEAAQAETQEGEASAAAQDDASSYPTKTIDGKEFQPWTSTVELPSERGSYYLINDVMLYNTWTARGVMSLDLNGHEIDTTRVRDVAIRTEKESHIFDLVSEGEFHLYDDSEGTGKILFAEDVRTAPIQVGTGTEFHMHGGTLTGMTSRNDGSVASSGTSVIAVTGGASFHMHGGTITGNQVTNAAVTYVDSDSFCVSGNARVTGNVNLERKERNVLTTSSGHTAPILVEGELTSDALIGISNDANKSDVFTTGMSGKATRQNFQSDDELCSVNLNEAGEAYLVEGLVYDDGTIFQPWKGTTGLPVVNEGTARYYLTNDVVLSDGWTSTTYARHNPALHLDLNGHTIRVVKDQAVDAKGNGYEFHLYDSTGSGKILLPEDTAEHGIKIENQATFVQHGGTITGFKPQESLTDSYYSAVIVKHGGRYRMLGGSVTGNVVSSNGGAVLVLDYYSFEVSGSPIVANNTAMDGTPRNVRLHNNSTVINVIGDLTDASIGVSRDAMGSITSGLDERGIDYFTSDDKGRYIKEVNGEAYLYFKESKVTVTETPDGTVEARNVTSSSRGTSKPVKVIVFSLS